MKHPFVQLVKTVLLLAAFSMQTLVFGAEPSLPDHVGEISSEELLNNYPEFRQEYESFSPTTEEITTFRELAGKDILALFGTWCHDSEREVPRLIKLMEVSGLPSSALTLYAVNRNKQDPLGYFEKYDLKFTPTLIVSENGVETTRMIEKPSSSLAKALTH